MVFYDPTISGLTYDYIRNYDVYRKDELEFNINSFTLEGVSTKTYLVPATLTDFTFEATYYPSGSSPDDAEINVQGTLASFADGSEWPVTGDDPDYDE